MTHFRENNSGTCPARNVDENQNSPPNAGKILDAF